MISDVIKQDAMSEKSAPMSGPPPPYSDQGVPPPAGYQPPPPGQGPAYPTQPGYPSQGGYPGQQGGYPDQQGGYPGQHGGYPGQPGYPNQPGYPGQPGYGQSSTVVIQQPHVVVGVTRFHQSPVRIQCTFCQADVVTATEYEIGSFTWLMAGAVCLGGCFFPLLWLGCCAIPCCIESCKDVVHRCPNCKQVVGRFNRLS